MGLGHSFSQIKTIISLNRININTYGGEGLGDDEYVVNANAEEYEGDDRVGCGVEEAKQWAETVAQDHAHGHTGTQILE